MRAGTEGGRLPLCVCWRRGQLDGVTSRCLCVISPSLFPLRSSSGGSRTYLLHLGAADCSYSISTNLFGRKLWYLFPPALTPLLKPLIVAAEREGRSVSCDWWSNEEKQVWHERGMMQIEQEAGETIFMCVDSLFSFPTPNETGLTIPTRNAALPASSTPSPTSPIRLSASTTTGPTLTAFPRCTYPSATRSDEPEMRSRTSRSCSSGGREIWGRRV